MTLCYGRSTALAMRRHVCCMLPQPGQAPCHARQLASFSGKGPCPVELGSIELIVLGARRSVLGARARGSHPALPLSHPRRLAVPLFPPKCHCVTDLALKRRQSLNPLVSPSVTLPRTPLLSAVLPTTSPDPHDALSATAPVGQCGRRAGRLRDCKTRLLESV